MNKFMITNTLIVLNQLNKTFTSQSADIVNYFKRIFVASRFMENPTIALNIWDHSDNRKIHFHSSFKETWEEELAIFSDHIHSVATQDVSIVDLKVIC